MSIKALKVMLGLESFHYCLINHGLGETVHNRGSQRVILVMPGERYFGDARSI